MIRGFKEFENDKGCVRQREGELGTKVKVISRHENGTFDLTMNIKD